MKIYHYFSLTLSLLLAVCLSTEAQNKAADLRTKETKIADIVMQLPAKDTKILNSLMEELSSINDPVSGLASLLLEPGKGDDSQVRYALAGLSFYVSQQGKQSQKEQTATQFCRAIEKTASDEIKDFLLIQLQYMAGNESLPTIQPLLDNTRLADAAARVLVRIGTEEANKILLNALTKAQNDTQKMVLAGALGDTRYTPAVQAISKLATSADLALRKTALKALAEIALPASQKTLFQAVKNVNFCFESTDALGSYILYLSRLEEKGEYKSLEKAAKELYEKTNSSTQLPAKSAGLQFCIQAMKEKSLPLVLKALDSKEPVLINMAAQGAVALQSAQVNTALLKRGQETTDPACKAAVLQAFGGSTESMAQTFIRENIHSGDKQIAEAAIKAYGKDRALPALPIIEWMQGSDDEFLLKAAQAVLLSKQDAAANAQVAAALPKAKPVAQTYLIDFLSQRNAGGQVQAVLALAHSSNQAVASSAKKALKNLVSAKDLPMIVSLINGNQQEADLLPLQEAYFAAIQSTGDASRQTEQTLAEMKKAPQQASSYYSILSMIGDKQGLEAISQAFQSNKAGEQAKAFEALTRWNGFEAAPTLFEIAGTDSPFAEKALSAYVAKVSGSKNSPEQKLIYLRDALAIAKTDGQTASYITEIAKLNTFTAAVTVGAYLSHNSNDIRQKAVQALFKIVQSNGNISGTAIRELIDQAIAQNKDPEAEYQKEAVMKQVKSWPEETGFVAVTDIRKLNKLYSDRSSTDFELYADRRLSPSHAWETYYVRVVGKQVSVFVNGKSVQHAIDTRSYQSTASALFLLQEKASDKGIQYRDLYCKEMPQPQAYTVSKEEANEGFVPLFNGIDMNGWTGNLVDYIAQDGMIVCDPKYGGRGNVYTEREYADFVLRFDFLLTPAANNGLGIRTPLEGDAAYVGMELQILDNTAEVYKNLKKHQYHGSVYGVIPAKRGALKPVGEWNTQEVIAQGNRIKITLNGTVILDGDIKEASENFTKTLDGRAHPGLSNPKGHIGFLGHGSYVSFKNLRIKEIK